MNENQELIFRILAFLGTTMFVLGIIKKRKILIWIGIIVWIINGFTVMSFIGPMS